MALGYHEAITDRSNWKGGQSYLVRQAILPGLVDSVVPEPCGVDSVVPEPCGVEHVVSEPCGIDCVVSRDLWCRQCGI